MKMLDYIKETLKTESRDWEPVMKRLQDKTAIRLLHVALGLVTEAGEIADALKKYIFYGKPLDVVNIKEEYGDVLWYLAVGCDETKTSFEEVANINVAKLRKRYGEKFTEEAAINRDVQAEYKLMENISGSQAGEKV